MRVPILAYHSYQAGDPRDILSFEENLRVIDAEGFRVFPLRKIVRGLVEGVRLPERIVGLSCDDGKRYDFVTEPTTGKSMQGVLRAFAKSHWLRRRDCELTCFVIADRASRTQIAFGDPELMNSDWWRPAARSGLIRIENHSLDHAHERVARPDGLPPYRNDFSVIRTVAEADAQIAVAARIIDHHVGVGNCALFAYPFGHYNDFLVQDYFPNYADRHGMIGALTVDARPVTRETNRWTIPRYVINSDIRDTADLVRLLAECRR